MATQIKISVKLINYRTHARQYFAGEYFAKVKPFKKILKDYMEANKGTTVLQALVACCQMDPAHNNPDCQSLFISAAVEMIYPSKK